MRLHFSFFIFGNSFAPQGLGVSDCCVDFGVNELASHYRSCERASRHELQLVMRFALCVQLIGHYFRVVLCELSFRCRFHCLQGHEIKGNAVVFLPNRPIECNRLYFAGIIGYAPEFYKILTSAEITDSDDDQLFYTKVFLDSKLRVKTFL